MHAARLGGFRGCPAQHSHAPSIPARCLSMIDPLIAHSEQNIMTHAKAALAIVEAGMLLAAACSAATSSAALVSRVDSCLLNAGANVDTPARAKKRTGRNAEAQEEGRRRAGGRRAGGSGGGAGGKALPPGRAPLLRVRSLKPSLTAHPRRPWAQRAPERFRRP